MSFPRYPEYKDSGVEWLGEVPAHWQVSPLKRGYEVVLGKMLQPDQKDEGECYAPYLRAANIQLSGVSVDEVKSMWFSAREQEILRLRYGDLLVSEGGDVGRTAFWEDQMPECYFQNSINRVRALNNNSIRHLSYWLVALKAKGYVDVLCNKSTIAHFTAEKLSSVPVPYPSIVEQSAIAAFLDHETARIDALVEEQKRLIELLKEKRQAVISHAVTKGLDPNVPMKDSGVEWLGEVPAHWEVKRLWTVMREVSEAGREDLPVLSVSIHQGVSDSELSDEELERKVTRSDDRSKYKRVLPGDLVYNMMRAWQGGFGAVKIEGMVSPAYVVARPISDVVTSYIEQLLRTPYAVEEMRRHSRGITDFRLRLYWEEFRQQVVPLPPLQEQEEIMAYVESEVRSGEILMQEVQRAHALLQEHRSALISAAVTGKIDVRGWEPSAASQTMAEHARETA